MCCWGAVRDSLRGEKALRLVFAGRPSALRVTPVALLVRRVSCVGSGLARRDASSGLARRYWERKCSGVWGLSDAGVCGQEAGSRGSTHRVADVSVGGRAALHKHHPRDLNVASEAVFVLMQSGEERSWNSVKGIYLVKASEGMTSKTTAALRDNESRVADDGDSSLATARARQRPAASLQ